MPDKREVQPDPHENAQSRQDYALGLGPRFARFIPELEANGWYVPAAGPHAAEIRKMMAPCIQAEEMNRRLQDPNASLRFRSDNAHLNGNFKVGG